MNYLILGARASRPQRAAARRLLIVLVKRLFRAARSLRARRLDADPLQDFANVKKINLRFKDGELLTLAP